MQSEKNNMGARMRRRMQSGEASEGLKKLWKLLIVRFANYMWNTSMSYDGISDMNLYFQRLFEAIGGNGLITDIWGLHELLTEDLQLKTTVWKRSPDGKMESSKKYHKDEILSRARKLIGEIK